MLEDGGKRFLFLKRAQPPKACGVAANCSSISETVTGLKRCRRACHADLRRKPCDNAAILLGADRKKASACHWNFCGPQTDRPQCRRSMAFKIVVHWKWANAPNINGFDSTISALPAPSPIKNLPGRWNPRSKPLPAYLATLLQRRLKIREMTATLERDPGGWHAARACRRSSTLFSTPIRARSQYRVEGGIPGERPARHPGQAALADNPPVRAQRPDNLGC